MVSCQKAVKEDTAMTDAQCRTAERPSSMPAPSTLTVPLPISMMRPPCPRNCVRPTSRTIGP